MRDIIRRPVKVLGSLDGIETGVRQLIRDQPLETTQIEYQGQTITIPTEAEMLRIKAVLILQRNATRDYLDFLALADHMGDEKVIEALRSFDRLYPQPSRESMPYDLEELNLAEYKNLDSRRHDRRAVKAVYVHVAILIFDRIAAL